MNKTILLTFLISMLALAGTAHAETLALKRGLPTDIWLTWPESSRLAEPGLAEVFPEYRQSFKGKEFQLVKDAGFDFVRLTVDPAIFLWKDNAAKVPKLVAGVTTAVDEILAHDLKVVVDLHSIPHDDATPGTTQVLNNADLFSQYLAVVGTVGRAIAKYPADRVGFEPMNEPTIDCLGNRVAGTKPRWPGMMRQLHAAARASTPRMTIILSGACWGGSEGLAAVDPKSIADENVMWSFHSYEPFIFTHQGASWSDGYIKHVSHLNFPPRPGDKKKALKEALAKLAKADVPKAVRKKQKAELAHDMDAYFQKGWAVKKAREPFDRVARWAKKHGIPAQRILLGEFGAIRADQGTPLSDAQRVPFLKMVREQAEQHGYAWSTWSWTGSFGMSKTDDTREFSPTLLQALGLPSQ
jgi:endoglucanase